MLGGKLIGADRAGGSHLKDRIVERAMCLALVLLLTLLQPT